jgi:hypothetical protein
MSIFVLFIFVGVFFWLSNLNIIDLARDWPVMVIVAGLVNLCVVFKKGRKKTVIDDLEKGNITVEEAEKKLRTIR